MCAAPLILNIDDFDESDEWKEREADDRELTDCY